MMATKDSAAQKAAAARKAAAALRAKQRAAARRNTILATMGALALVAVFVVVVLFIVKGSNSAYAVYNSGELTVPSVAEEESGGVLVSTGGVAGGTPPDGLVRIDLYEDPLCPICKALTSAIDPVLDQLNEAGFIALYFHPIAILDYNSAGSNYSTRAVSALWTVAEHAPERFWVVVEAFYANQPEELVKGLTNTQIAELLLATGVPEDVVYGPPDEEDATDGLAKGEFTQWTFSATSQSALDGVNGTPTTRVEGVEQYWKFYTYYPGILMYDVLVAMDGGSEALAAVAAERESLYSTGYEAERDRLYPTGVVDGDLTYDDITKMDEAGLAAVQPLLEQQLAELQAAANPTPSPSPSA
jgi:protein-disulfide isomerase